METVVFVSGGRFTEMSSSLKKTLLLSKCLENTAHFMPCFSDQNNFFYATFYRRQNLPVRKVFILPAGYKNGAPPEALNLAGIAGLSAGVDWIAERGLKI